MHESVLSIHFHHYSAPLQCTVQFFRVSGTPQASFFLCCFEILLALKAVFTDQFPFHKVH